MADSKRLKELNKIIDGIHSEQATVIRPLLKDIVFLEERLNDLRKLPQIRVHKTDKTRQEPTAAAKQYKEAAQTYANIIKIVLMALYRDETDGATELIEALKEFSL